MRPILQCYRHVRCKWDFCTERGSNDTSKRLAIDIYFPACLLRQLLREFELRKANVPDSQEVVQRHIVDFGRCLDVDDAVTGMGMHPVITHSVRAYPNALRNLGGFPIDVDADMHVNMVGNLLRAIAWNPVNRRIERIDIDHILDLQVDETHNRQEDYCAANRSIEHNVRQTALLAALVASLSSLYAQLIFSSLWLWYHLLVTHTLHVSL